MKLMTALNAELGKRKGARGVAGVWDVKCDAIFANHAHGDRYLKWYLEERLNAEKVYGDASYLLNPVTMVCPIRTCQPRQSLNGPCGIKYHYSASTAHLQRKHPHNPIAQRLVKRWKALHADDASGGRLISVTDLDNMEGCELKLWDKDWLDANLGTEDEPVGDIRPPPSDFPDHFAPDIAENSETARTEWLAAHQTETTTAE